jgi:hypothetical protein
VTELTADQLRFLDEARAEAAAVRASPGFPAEDVAAVERAVERCRSGAGVHDLRRALAGIERSARIDVDVPTASRLPLARWVKALVKRTVGWYLNFLGQRITIFGRAVVALGAALTDRVESLEDRVEALERRERDGA